MELINNLYRIDRIDESNSTAVIELQPDCIIYKAHFPDKPVTPGVCLIGIAVELASALAGESLKLGEVVNAKFLNIVDPLLTNLLTYKFSIKSNGEGVLKTAVDILNDSTLFARLSLLLYR